MTDPAAPEAATTANSRERTRRLNTLPADRRVEAVGQYQKMRVGDALAAEVVALRKKQK